MPITLVCPVCHTLFTAKPYVATRKNTCCSVRCANILKTTDPIKRFWSKVDKRQLDKCWLWIGYKDKDGYGTFSPISKSLVRAHRFAYILENGPIPKGISVLHICDNPPCCNPKHLFLGTATDNDKDRDNKWRTAKGERSGRTFLKASDILLIRDMHQRGISESEIAHEFGISQTGISGIVCRRTWKHI